MTHDDFLLLIDVVKDVYIAVRYILIAQLMGLGAVFLLCYLGGRKGSK